MQKRGNVKMNFVQNTIKYFRVLFEESSSKLLQSVLILVIGWWIVNKVCKIATIFFQKGISGAHQGQSDRGDDVSGASGS